MRLGMLLLFLFSAGCINRPPLTGAGFLNDYSKLEKIDDTRMLYVSPRLREFTTYAINPVEFAVPAQKLEEADRAEIAAYFREKIIESLRSHRYSVVEDDAVGVARVRLALTDVVSSAWWQKIHPGMRMTGAGTGGAAVEGEIIESTTGEQLAAWVATNNANRFDFTAFSTVADIKNVIDRWAAEAAGRLDALRAGHTGNQ